MKKEDYVLEKEQMACIDALLAFHRNAFLGYPKGKGAKEEEELKDSFIFLVTDYLSLLKNSLDSVDEYLERFQQYKEIFKKQ